MIATRDLEAHIPAIARPTLVVARAEDDNAPVAARRRIADLIPVTTFHALADVGHFPPFDAPDAFNDLLRAYLAGL